MSCLGAMGYNKLFIHWPGFHLIIQVVPVRKAIEAILTDVWRTVHIGIVFRVGASDAK